MWRSNNYVALSGYVSDTSTDDYCATLQISYEIYENGSWVGHHHKRQIPGVYDCSTGTSDDGTSGQGYVFSRPKVRNVYSRACHADTNGSIIHCESNWHGPI